VKRVAIIEDGFCIVDVEKTVYHCGDIYSRWVDLAYDS